MLTVALVVYLFEGVAKLCDHESVEVFIAERQYTTSYDRGFVVVHFMDHAHLLRIIQAVSLKAER